MRFHTLWEYSGHSLGDAFGEVEVIQSCHYNPI
jgi:hypothetical protein